MSTINIIDAPNVSLPEAGKFGFIYDKGSNMLLGNIFESPIAVVSPYTLVLADSREECEKFIADNGIINNI